MEVKLNKHYFFRNMEPLTADELQAIAITLHGIRYPDSDKKFIMEIYYGIFFRELSNKFQVNNNTLKQKLENMQINHPHQFKNILEKMKVFWDTNPAENHLRARLYELGLI